ncbi:MAG: LamG-like jellyroll fold domain-containing protein [Gemmataceae bacterium]
MSDKYVPPEELRRLLAELADGLLSEESERRLAEILREDREARAYYIDHVSLATALHWEYAAAATPTERIAEPGSAPRRRWILSGAVGAVGMAAGLLLALALPSRLVPTKSPSAPLSEPTDDGVAVLLQSFGAVWEDTGLPTRPGATLRPGRLVLKSGVVHVQFYSGATVVLEGPADFRLVGPLEAYCARGKLRATVPPHAQGFTVGTPKLDLIDRGTEFGVSVGSDAATEVHVFQGSVELYDAGTGRSAAQKQELTTGRGMRVAGAAAGQPIVSDSASFVTARELNARADDQHRRRFAEWKSASDALAKDKRLLAYYSFQPEQPWDRVLRDRGPGGRDGAVVGCEWAVGRWPGKQALEFKRPGDRVRLTVPGEYDALTFAAWVRFDALDHVYSGLLMTDRWGDGSVHWQCDNAGTLYLNVKHSQGNDNRTRTGRVLGADVLGQWTHVAVTFDDQAGTITHYVNGRPVGTFDIVFTTPLRINAAEIGNYGSPFLAQTKSPIRNLNGRMDEFAIFDAALSEGEIAELYRAGRPAP